MSELLDLRGVKCPLNWAKAKVRLEGLARGTVLELWLDDPKGVRDIPRAAEAEGYVVIRLEPTEPPPLGSVARGWRLLIQK